MATSSHQPIKELVAHFGARMASYHVPLLFNSLSLQEDLLYLKLSTPLFEA